LKTKGIGRLFGSVRKRFREVNSEELGYKLKKGKEQFEGSEEDINEMRKKVKEKKNEILGD
jgi:hypothetical protein